MAQRLIKAKTVEDKSISKHSVSGIIQRIKYFKPALPDFTYRVL